MPSGPSTESASNSEENPFLHEDQRDLISAFLDQRVEFLVVGGYAFSAHAFSRATKDVDLWINPTPQNASSVYAALTQYGAPLDAHEVTVEDFTTAGMFYQLGLPPARVDLLTAMAELDYASAWKRRIDSTLAGLPVPVIGLDDLIHAKKTAGRPQDLVDLDALYRVKKRKEDSNP